MKSKHFISSLHPSNCSYTSTYILQGQYGQHKVMSKEWLQTGNCPIPKSYWAVSGVKLKCPPAIVAAGAALAQTPFAKNLRTQPLPTKILAIGVLGTAANVPLGIWREHTKKFSPAWFAAVHAAVPFIAMLRKCVLMPKTAMAFTIGASILGQVIGSRAERYRLQAKAARKLAPIEASPVTVREPKDLPVVAVASEENSLGNMRKWDCLTLRVSESAPPTRVCCPA